MPGGLHARVVNLKLAPCLGPALAASFKFANHARTRRLAGVLIEPEVRSRSPQTMANFGLGILTSADVQVRRPFRSGPRRGAGAEPSAAAAPARAAGRRTGAPG